MAMVFVDADRLDDLAARLDRWAEQVLALGDELARKAAEALWTSVAADSFRGQVARRRDYCAQVSDRLHVAAHEMRRHAQNVRDQIAVILAIENAVRDFVSAAASGLAHVATTTVSTAAHVASSAASLTVNTVSTAVDMVKDAVDPMSWVPDTLPPSGDPAWLDIGRCGRLAGALP